MNLFRGTKQRLSDDYHISTIKSDWMRSFVISIIDFLAIHWYIFQIDSKYSKNHLKSINVLPKYLSHYIDLWRISLKAFPFHFFRAHLQIDFLFIYLFIYGQTRRKRKRYSTLFSTLALYYISQSNLFIYFGMMISTFFKQDIGISVQIFPIKWNDRGKWSTQKWLFAINKNEKTSPIDVWHRYRIQYCFSTCIRVRYIKQKMYGGRTCSSFDVCAWVRCRF